MTHERLRQLRESGESLRAIGELYTPPVTYETVRRDCMRHGIVVNLRGPSPQKVRHWGQYRLPEIDPARAQEITDQKRRYWREQGVA